MRTPKVTEEEQEEEEDEVLTPLPLPALPIPMLTASGGEASRCASSTPMPSSSGWKAVSSRDSGLADNLLEAVAMLPELPQRVRELEETEPKTPVLLLQDDTLSPQPPAQPVVLVEEEVVVVAQFVVVAALMAAHAAWRQRAAGGSSSGGGACEAADMRCSSGEREGEMTVMAQPACVTGSGHLVWRHQGCGERVSSCYLQGKGPSACSHLCAHQEGTACSSMTTTTTERWIQERHARQQQRQLWKLAPLRLEVVAIAQVTQQKSVAVVAAAVAVMVARVVCWRQAQGALQLQRIWRGKGRLLLCFAQCAWLVVWKEAASMAQAPAVLPQRGWCWPCQQKNRTLLGPPTNDDAPPLLVVQARRGGP